MTHMRQIIACASVPMTHISVKDKGTHFHGIFGWHFDSLECTCDAQSGAGRYQKLCKVTKVLASQTDNCKRGSKLVIS